MPIVRHEKVISSLPSTLTADTIYYVRTGDGFDLHVADSTGSIAHRVNTASAVMVIDPADYGAVGDGTTDDTAALQAMIDDLVYSNDRAATYSNIGPRVVDLGGKTYLISASLRIGTMGGTNRVIHQVQFQNGKLEADPNGTWTGTVATGVSAGYMVLVCDEDAAFSTETNIGLYRIGFVNVQLRCRFVASGILLRNTDSCYVEKMRVEEMVKNGKGIVTGGSSNGAFMCNDCFVQGYEETSGLTYPTGEDIDTMGTRALEIQTNDARVNDFICCKCTYAIYVDNCGAVQFDNIHPWSRQIYIGPNAKRTMWSNVYFDWTTIHLDGSFKHFFTGCHLLLGGEQRWLRLTAHNANETGGDLRFSGYINGQSGQATGGVLHDTSGVGTWAEEKDRTYTLDITTEVEGRANVPVPFRVSNFMWLENSGKAHFQRVDDATKGRVTLSGNNVFIGNGRSTDGYASATLYSKADGTDGAIIEAFTTGYVTFGSLLGSTELLANSESYLSLSAVDGTVKARKTFNVIDPDVTKGDAKLTGNILTLGDGRTTDGLSAIYFTHNTAGQSASIETYASGQTQINSPDDFKVFCGGLEYMRVFHDDVDTATRRVYFTQRTRVGAPTATDDAATKGYVDSAVASAGGWVGSATSLLDMNNYDIIDARSVTTNGAANIGGYLTVSGGMGNSGGNFYMGGTAYRITGCGQPSGTNDVATKVWVVNSYSDERLKFDIEPMEPVLDAITSLDPVRFSYRDIGESHDAGRTFGLLAQDVQRVFPELVRQRETTHIFDQTVMDWREIEDPLGLDYRGLVTPLVAAVKELTARVVELERRQGITSPTDLT